MTTTNEFGYTHDMIQHMLDSEATTKEDIDSVIEEIIEHVNCALLVNDFTEIASWQDPIDQLCNKYTSLSRNEMFDECIDASDPMKAAITALTFSTIKVSEAGIKKGKKVPAVKSERTMDIDLLALKRYSKGHGGKQIGHERNWDSMAQKLNFRLSFRKGQEIGDPKWREDNLKNISDAFIMSDFAKEFKFKADPADDENCKAALQEVVDAMVGKGYTVDDTVVNWVTSCFGQKGRTAKQLIMPNARSFVMILRDACNKLMVGDTFIADSKSFKKK